MSMENGYCLYLYHVQVLEINVEVQSLVLELMRHLIRGKIMEDTKNSFMWMKQVEVFNSLMVCG